MLHLKHPNEFLIVVNILCIRHQSVFLQDYHIFFHAQSRVQPWKVHRLSIVKQAAFAFSSPSHNLVLLPFERTVDTIHYHEYTSNSQTFKLSCLSCIYQLGQICIHLSIIRYAVFVWKWHIHLMQS